MTERQFQVEVRRQVRVRPAEGRDAAALRRLFTDASGETCERLASSGDAFVAVAVPDGEVIGVAGRTAMGRAGESEAAVFVASGWRGLGIGSLLASAVGSARRVTLVGDVA